MKIVTSNTIQKKTKDIVWAGLLAYNAQFAERNQQDFTITATERGKIMGGAVGESKFAWLIVHFLWIDPQVRNKGIGTKIMAQVEALARRRGCIGVFLDTFSFQAPNFMSNWAFVDLEN